MDDQTSQSARSSRREAASDERLEVLRLLEQGAITAEEAARLLDALDSGSRTTRPPSTAGDPARHVRIKVTDSGSGRSKVNLTLPLGLLDAGFGIASRFVPGGLIGDPASLRDSITAGFRGPLLDVDDEDERVEIIVE